MPISKVSICLLIIFLFVAFQFNLYFGENLRILRTKYVDVIYQEGLERAIDYFVKNVDNIYEDMVNFYGIEPDERLKVLITDETDIANAYSTPFDDFIKIYVNGDTGNISKNYMDWISFVFTHEFTHTILGNYYNPYYSVLRVFGNPFPSMLISPFIPLYMQEGLSIFSETKFNILKGGRMNDSKFQMYLRMDALSGNFKGLELAGGYSHHRQWAPGGMMYEYGASFVKFLVEMYGEKALLHFLKEFFNSPMLGVGRALKRVTGKDMKELIEDWKRYEKKKAKEFLRYVGSEGIRKGKRITKYGRWSGVYDLYVGKEPKLLVYLDRPDSYCGIFSLSFDGRIIKRFKDIGDVPLEIKISPSGKYVAILNLKVMNYGLNVFSNMVILDLQSRKKIEEFDRIVGFDWMDNVNLVVIRQEKGMREISILNWKNRTFRRLLGKNTKIFPESVAWGNGRVFFTGRFEGKTDIFELNDDTIYRLTNDEYNEIDLSYTKDMLIYSRDEFGRKFSAYNIYTLDLRNLKEYKLTNVVGGAFQPIMRNNVLFYRGYSKDGYDVYMLENPMFEQTNRDIKKEVLGIKEDFEKSTCDLELKTRIFENNIRPRIWPILPNIYVSEEESFISVYFLTALWDILEKNFITAYGKIESSNEIFNTNLIFQGGDILKYYLEFNEIYNIENGLKSSMKSYFSLDFPFGSSVDPMNLNISMFMSLNDFNKDINFTLSLLKDHIRNRYFGNYWKMNFYTSFDPIDIHSLIFGGNLVFFGSGSMITPMFNLKPYEYINFGLFLKHPLFIIDKGTYDGMYAINSIDFWTLPSISISFKDLKEKMKVKIGMDTSFVFQYYLNLKLTLGVECDEDGLKPFVSLGQDIGISFPCDPYDRKDQDFQMALPVKFCDFCKERILPLNF